MGGLQIIGLKVLRHRTSLSINLPTTLSVQLQRSSYYPNLLRSVLIRYLRYLRKSTLYRSFPILAHLYHRVGNTARAPLMKYHESIITATEMLPQLFSQLLHPSKQPQTCQQALLTDCPRRPVYPFRLVPEFHEKLGFMT
jgi:hypothetical protein